MVEEEEYKGMKEWEILPAYFATFRDENVVSSVTSRIN
jgi:hypothetical protein